MKATFTPVSRDSEMFIPPPQKASAFLPEWFKNIPTHEQGYDGNKLSKYSPGTSLTIKGCNPFLDTLTGGYIFQLAADVEFSFQNGMFVPKWLVEYPLITGQAAHQTEHLPKTYGPTEAVFKWIAGWKINTPKGYSTLFTHPMNRHDLPFRTMSGIVETDKYNLETDFPFQILNPNNELSIVIKKGTPICQAIPFKRDNWTSEVLPFDEDEQAKSKFNLGSIIDRSYRNQFWERKIYN